MTSALTLVGAITAMLLMWWLDWRVHRRAFARMWGEPEPRFNNTLSTWFAFVTGGTVVGALYSHGSDRAAVVIAGVLAVSVLVTVAAVRRSRHH